MKGHSARSRSAQPGVALRQRVVGTADEMEVVGTEELRLELGGFGAHGGQGEVGLPGQDAFDAGLREHVGDLDRDRRMRGAIACKDIGQPVGCQRRQHGHRDAAALQRRVVVNRRDRRVEVTDEAARRRLEVGALGAQRHVALAAIEETNADGRLEATDQRAEGRLRQVHGRRRAGEVALVREEHEGAQLAQRRQASDFQIK